MIFYRVLIRILSNERTIHVFGNRFKNKVVDANSYGLWLSQYIHRQVVEAGLVSNPENYEWTSYHTYIGYRKDTVGSAISIMNGM